MGFLKEFIKNWREQREEDLYHSGYDYALKTIVKEGPAVVTKLYNQAANAFDRNAFDKGIEAALQDYFVAVRIVGG